MGLSCWSSLAVTCILSYFLGVLVQRGEILFAGCILMAAIIILLKFMDKKIETAEDFHVCIIGAGFSGICMGKKLNDLGIRYTILEKSPSLGGTWWENVYPGVVCDVPSHLYSFSFEQNPFWAKGYSPGSEILTYLQMVAEKFGVTPNVRLNTRVKSSIWSEATSEWNIVMEDGTQIQASIMVSATGALHVPHIPSFPGEQQFQGQKLHTAQWNTNFDPKDKSVAVIGTGASSVQIVPSLAAMGVKELLVFQRTPCWCPPKFDFFYPQYLKTLFSFVPLAGTLHRYFYFWRGEFRFWIIFCKPNWLTKKLRDVVHSQVRYFTRKAVKNRELAKKLTPAYSMGCKRITPSDRYLQTFNKPFVHLITENIASFTRDGIQTSEKIHKVDTIIYATGFDILKSGSAINWIGSHGKSIQEEFGDAPSAYLGINHPHYPNAFVLLGPGTGLGHNSIIYMIECQVNYAADAIVKMLECGVKAMTIKTEVYLDYMAWLSENMRGMVFADNSQAKSWYRNYKGINWTLYPAGLIRYWWQTSSCNLNMYNLKYRKRSRSWHG